KPSGVGAHGRLRRARLGVPYERIGTPGAREDRGETGESSELTRTSPQHRRFIVPFPPPDRSPTVTGPTSSTTVCSGVKLPPWPRVRTVRIGGSCHDDS